MKFSSRKDKVIEYNTKEEGQWVLGNNVLEIVENYTYLGIVVSKKGIGGVTKGNCLKPSSSSSFYILIPYGIGWFMNLSHSFQL